MGYTRFTPLADVLPNPAQTGPAAGALPLEGGGGAGGKAPAYAMFSRSAVRLLPCARCRRFSRSRVRKRHRRRGLNWPAGRYLNHDGLDGLDGLLLIRTQRQAEKRYRDRQSAYHVDQLLPETGLLFDAETFQRRFVCGLMRVHICCQRLQIAFQFRDCQSVFPFITVHVSDLYPLPDLSKTKAAADSLGASG